MQAVPRVLVQFGFLKTLLVGRVEVEVDAEVRVAERGFLELLNGRAIKLLERPFRDLSEIGVRNLELATELLV